MAIASGGEKVVLEATLNNIHLRDFFNIVVSIDNVEKGKPEPDIFLLASQRLGVAPQDCIIYEDSDETLKAAHRVGMRSIDVRILWQTQT
ncbi:HAD-IA family hydrolase [Nostoc sp. UHCC 0252]|uniref:HAD-IA family hydrolase n=1 Tax=Nostoc sp. UHCC 0252 TaxID=3110241 RepID=UPI002B1E9D97|nr:HAD-IA family hydrolase [Nostoc sp. UHCC 0252]MEA5604573.1 HAD-IA family hydrolase [Nostoc sp. UHCC 0252]